jgi:poly(3-hydroxybutyrate) depolymerase
MTALTTVLALCAVLAGGEGLPRGTVVPSVACTENPKQTYALYLPSKYTPERKWPVLYCLDPGARGRLPVERFAAAAEREGFIVAGSNNARNGPLEPVKEAIGAMTFDTRRRFAIDDGRVYSAGFSGGARVALAWAHGSDLAGAVACGAAFGGKEIPPVRFRAYLAAGVDDFNYDELRALSVALGKGGTAHRFVEFEGGHEWLPATLAAEALAFFNGRIEGSAAGDTKEWRKSAARFQDDYERLWSLDLAGRRAAIERLGKEAAKAEDSPKRRLARRVLGGSRIQAIEESRRLKQAGDEAGAREMLEIAEAVRKALLQ